MRELYATDRENRVEGRLGRIKERKTSDYVIDRLVPYVILLSRTATAGDGPFWHVPTGACRCAMEMAKMGSSITEKTVKGQMVAIET